MASITTGGSTAAGSSVAQSLTNVFEVGSQTATSTSHYLVTGQRITLAVPPDANIAAIQGSASGTLYISELTQ
jgi:hypothetical protein